MQLFPLDTPKHIEQIREALRSEDVLAALDRLLMHEGAGTSLAA